MTQKEITVLMVEPGKHPKVTTLKDDLDSLQKAVSIGADYQGLIEFVTLGNGDCIMCNEEGKPIYPEYLSQLFTKLQKKSGLPKCRFHNLRHLCASIMLMQGVNVKVAQEHLGYKDISTTMNIYSHVLPSVAKEAAQKIGALVYEAG